MHGSYSARYGVWHEVQVRLTDAERAAVKACSAERGASRTSMEELSSLRSEAHQRFLEMMAAMEEQLVASRVTQCELPLLRTKDQPPP